MWSLTRLDRPDRFIKWRNPFHGDDDQLSSTGDQKMPRQRYHPPNERDGESARAISTATPGADQPRQSMMPNFLFLTTQKKIAGFVCSYRVKGRVYASDERKIE